MSDDVELTEEDLEELEKHKLEIQDVILREQQAQQREEQRLIDEAMEYAEETTSRKAHKGLIKFKIDEVTGEVIEIIPEKKGPIYPKPYDIFNINDEVLKILNIKRVEVELSLGTFRQRAGKASVFIPGLLSAVQFSAIKDTLKSMKELQLSIFNTRVEISSVDNIRKITDMDTGLYFYQSKIRDRKQQLDNYIYGYRISISTERNLDEPPRKFVVDVTRDIQRFSFRVMDKNSKYYGYRFDLSRIIETADRDKVRNKYEVEIERDNKATEWITNINKLAHSFKECLQLVLDSMYTLSPKTSPIIISLPQREYIVRSHNRLFSSDMRNKGVVLSNKYLLFKNYWNKPTDLKITDLLDFQFNTYTTVKFDGVRRGILFDTNGIFMYGVTSNDVWLFRNTIPPPKLVGTLLDGEYISSLDVFFVFDVIFVGGKDVRELDFSMRMTMLHETSSETTNIISYKDYILDTNNIGIVVKEFYTNEDFYDRCNKALDEVDSIENMGIRTDGLVFQPLAQYTNSLTRKWKPERLLTIDFRLVRIKDTYTYELFSTSPKGDVKFEGTNMYPYNNLIDLQDTRGTFEGESVSNRIVECNYYDGEFHILRYRDDRDNQNSITTARDIWMDIHKPIPEKTLRGENLQLSRKYHNIEKKRMLTTYAKNTTIIDIGSGRGGDLDKWSSLGIRSVVVDPSEENLDVLRDRLSNMKKKPTVYIVPVGAENYNEISKVVLDNKLHPTIVSSFFSMGSFSESYQVIEEFANSISRLLPFGGRFIGIAMDGDRVRKLLDDIRTRDNIPMDESSDYASTAFAIQQLSRFKDTGYGDKISITIDDPDSMVKEQTEWLLHFDTLKSVLASKSISLIKDGFLDKGYMYDKLPTESKVFSSLFRYFVFQRKEIKSIEEHVKITLPHTIPLSITSSGENGTLLECVVYSYDEKYRNMDTPSRKDYISKIRRSLAKRLTLERFSRLDKGELSKRLITVAEIESIGTDVSVNLEQVAYATYKNILSSNDFLGEGLILEYLCTTLGISVLILDRNLHIRKYLDKSYETFVVLYTVDDRLYYIVLHDNKMIHSIDSKLVNLL